MMDYKDLLVRYIKHIVECEGVDFLSQSYINEGDVEFSEDDINELKKLSKDYD